MPNTTAEPPGGKLPSYRNPPVVEVVYGIRFSTGAPLQTRHLGQFWQSLAADYPTTEDAFPLMEASEIASKMMPIPIPLRRILAHSGDGQYTIQVQDSRLYAGWRRTGPAAVYPRSPAVEERFEAAWARFTSFASAQGLGQAAEKYFELTYVNQIAADGGFPSTAEKYLKTLRFSSLRGDQFAAPRGLNATWRFALGGDTGEGTITAADAEVQGKRVLRLTLACGGPPTGTGRREWFAAAHDWIVRGFTELTTDTGHAEWEREP